MNQPPAFQFYVDNFVEGTSDMSPHEVGCYMRLLCYQWSRGLIPSDRKKIRVVCGGVVSDLVLSKFPKGINARLEKERAKQQAWREKSSKGGIKGAATRASRVVEPPLIPPFQPPTQPNGNTPSPSPVSNIAAQTNKGAAYPALEEVKTHAQFIGMTPDDAEQFWHHFESSGWIDKNGHPVANWRSKQATWKTVSRSTPAEAAHHNGSGQAANGIALAKEYERCIARIKQLQDGCAQDAMGARFWRDVDKSERDTLVARRNELKKTLKITI